MNYIWNKLHLLQPIILLFVTIQLLFLRVETTKNFPIFPLLQAPHNHISILFTGFIDDVILPCETRQRICADMRWLKDKKQSNPWKKHGNIPL